MAIINSYRIGTPKASDLLAGTSMPLANTDADPITVNFPISGIVALATGNLKSKKLTITTAQLKVSGNNPVKVIDLEDDQVADVISVMVRVNNQSAANKLTFAQPLTIEPATPSGVSYKYIIPVSVANSEVVGQFYKPVIDAGYSDIGPVIGDVLFKNSITNSNPIETGTATTTIDIYVTYRIINTEA